MTLSQPAHATPDAAGSPSARRGRPAQLTGAEREARILDAIEQVVATKGLQGASMAAIARAAAMSKRTLYACYPSRDALFEAWVRRLRAAFVRPLTADERALPLRARLRRLLRREVEDGASQTRLTVLRAIIAEAPRHPDLARAFLREGPRAVRRTVAEELSRAVENGEIVAGDVNATAHLLCDMVCASPLDPLIDPDAAPLSAAEAEARLERALDVFLNGAATPQRAERSG